MKGALLSLILLSGLVCILAYQFGFSFAPSKLFGWGQDQTPALAGDKASTEEEEDPTTFSSEFEINATPEQCFRVAVGFEDHHPHFARSLQWVKVHKRTRDGTGQVVEFKAGLALGYAMTYTLEYEFDYPKGLRWHATKGFKAMVGSYVFTRIGKSRTHVVYQMRIDPGFHVPNFLKRPIAGFIVQSSIKEFKSYIESPEMQALLAGGKQP
eukprot:CAMPEP_0196752090 /NCGR_PEP_ID=MMETSP1091-20130531/85965_1 /TAXON_ID=302021 /ORGANISM="Rhodomonas sp., Strain CCMP768" /LENGTH=210 /DNA_ID=CAMNT_0042099979 /DNA_START=240 /DNA_END=868 /DNA_ORIENTATION=+